MVKSKQKVVGIKKYINMSTGEQVKMQVIESTEENKDFNFYKLLMKDVIAEIDMVSNKKTKLCYWIIDNINIDNQLMYTYREIAEKTRISYRTVAETIKTLIDVGFLHKYGKVLIVNSDIIFKGSAINRANILHTYKTVGIKDEQTNIQTKIKNIQNTIGKLTKQLERLSKQNKKYSGKLIPMVFDM